MDALLNQNNNLSDSTYLNNTAYSDKSSLMKMKTLGDSKSVDMAAKEFSSIFIGKMLKIMRESSFKSELGHAKHGEDVFQNMLDDEYARQVAYNDSFGLTGLIADSIQRRNSIEASQ